AHVFADVGVVAGMVFVDAGDRRHDLARRAVAALEGIMLDKGLLHRVKVAVVIGEPFDRGYRAILHARRERQAGQHAPPIKQYGAGAALTVVATLLRASKTKMFA